MPQGMEPDPRQAERLARPTPSYYQIGRRSRRSVEVREQERLVIESTQTERRCSRRMETVSGSEMVRRR
jgi:hypothetical protein